MCMGPAPHMPRQRGACATQIARRPPTHPRLLEGLLVRLKVILQAVPLRDAAAQQRLQACYLRVQGAFGVVRGVSHNGRGGQGDFARGGAAGAEGCCNGKCTQSTQTGVPCCGHAPSWLQLAERRWPLPPPWLPERDERTACPG